MYSTGWMVQFLANVACLSELGTSHKYTQNDLDKFVGVIVGLGAFMRRWKAVCDHVVLILSLVSDFECDSLDATNALKFLLD